MNASHSTQLAGLRPAGSRLGWVVAAAVLAVFLIGWAGWAVYAAAHPAKAVRVERTFEGTIALVNVGGEAGCVAPDGGGNQVCGVFAVDPSKPLHVNQIVRVALERASVGDQTFDLMVVYSP